MANASISGLASGLDTATIIEQLMSIEAAPQTRLKARVTSEQSLVTTLQTLNTKIALLGTKAEALGKPASWSPLVATSSNSNVSVVTAAGASPTRLSVSVTGVARTHQLGFTTGAALTDVVTGSATTVRLDRLDGTSLTLETGDGTLGGLVTALNDPANATGVRASAVRTSEGVYRLLVESEATGVAQDFDLTAADGSALLGGSTVRAGSDASLSVAAGITVTSTTNTFTDVLPGVSLTLGPDVEVGASSTVAVTRDTASLTTRVSGFVDAVNAVLADIDAQTSYDASTNKRGALLGDANVRSLRSALLEAVYPADGTSMAPLGIEVDRNGKLVFNAETFTAAAAADPAGVAARFTSATDGLASRYTAVTKGASDPTTGTISAAITGRRAGIDRMNDNVEDWDLRLELRRTSLTRQFTALETAMNQMTSQSNWLSGQIASLPSNSSS